MHYKNGREVKIGDPVIGTCYNTKGTVVGILVGVVPGSNSCNARVVMVRNVTGDQFHKTSYAYRHDSTKPELDVYVEMGMDYTQCDYLLHAEDATCECKGVEVK